MAQANTEIQLRAMTVPVNPENSSAKREAAITVILVLDSKEQAFYVCEMTPRLRDSILEALYDNPIPISARNVMDLHQAEALLLQAGNKALKSPILVAVKVKPGAEELKTGSSRSRASALGCGEVEEQQKKQERQQQRR